VKRLIDLPILSINLEDAPVEYILNQVISQTDASIINAVSSFKESYGKLPSAMEILDELADSTRLKKTQLYDRLSRLANRGFVSVKLLPRPRRYQVSADMIKEGLEKWLHEQTVSLEGLTNELLSIQNFLIRIDTGKLALAIANKLSIKSS